MRCVSTDRRFSSSTLVSADSRTLPGHAVRGATVGSDDRRRDILESTGDIGLRAAATAAVTAPGAVGRVDPLIASLYRAALGEEDWGQVCRRVCDAFGLAGFHVLGLERPGGAIRFLWEAGDAIATAAGADLPIDRRRFATARAWVDDESTGWRHSMQALGAEFVAATGQFVDYADAYDRRAWSRCRVMSDERLVVHLYLVRRDDRALANLGHLDEIELVRRHLAHAIRLRLVLERRSAQHEATGSMLQLLPQAAAIVELDRTVVRDNRRWRQLLAEHRLFDAPGGRLVCHDGPSAEQLDAVFARIAAAAPDRSAAPTPTATTTAVATATTVQRPAGPVRLAWRTHPKDGGTAFFVLAVGLRGGRRGEGGFERAARVLLIVHPLNQMSVLDRRLVGEAFGLTLAEATVGTRIAHGVAPADIAAERRVSTQTVRTQLRTIYRKTGVRRQSDLVRVLGLMPRLDAPGAPDAP